MLKVFILSTFIVGLLAQRSLLELRFNNNNLELAIVGESTGSPDDFPIKFDKGITGNLNKNTVSSSYDPETDLYAFSGIGGANANTGVVGVVKTNPFSLQNFCYLTTERLGCVAWDRKTHQLYVATHQTTDGAKIYLLDHTTCNFTLISAVPQAPTVTSNCTVDPITNDTTCVNTTTPNPPAVVTNQFTLKGGNNGPQPYCAFNQRVLYFFDQATGSLIAYNVDATTFESFALAEPSLNATVFSWKPYYEGNQIFFNSAGNTYQINLKPNPSISKVSTQQLFFTRMAIDETKANGPVVIAANSISDIFETNFANTDPKKISSMNNVGGNVVQTGFEVRVGEVGFNNSISLVSNFVLVAICILSAFF